MRIYITTLQVHTCTINEPDHAVKQLAKISHKVTHRTCFKLDEVYARVTRRWGLLSHAKNKIKLKNTVQVTGLSI